MRVDRARTGEDPTRFMWFTSQSSFGPIDSAESADQLVHPLSRAPIKSNIVAVRHRQRLAAQDPALFRLLNPRLTADGAPPDSMKTPPLESPMFTPEALQLIHDFVQERWVADESATSRQACDDFRYLADQHGFEELLGTLSPTPRAPVSELTTLLLYLSLSASVFWIFEQKL